jgi:hypothetical protein
VLGLVHPHEGVRAHHDLHQLPDRRRAEGDVVAQHRGDVLVRVHEAGAARGAVEVHTLDDLGRSGAALRRERGVRVADVAGDGVGELRHRVEVVHDP